MNTFDQRAIVRQVSAFVADALGEGWSVDTSEAYAEHTGVYVDGPDGARLWLTLGGRNYGRDLDRLSIRGQYPRPEESKGYGDGWSKRFGETRTDEISVKRDRDPAAIAREIRRRLLPDYLEMLGEAVAGNAAHDAAVRRGRELRADLAARLGKGTRVDDARGDVSTPYYGSDTTKVSATFKAHDHSDGVSEVELRWMTAEQALKLADFLATL